MIKITKNAFINQDSSIKKTYTENSIEVKNDTHYYIAMLDYFHSYFLIREIKLFSKENINNISSRLSVSPEKIEKALRLYNQIIKMNLKYDYFYYGFIEEILNDQINFTQHKIYELLLSPNERYYIKHCVMREYENELHELSKKHLIRFI